MDQEQIEKTIQFLLENQTKFRSDLEIMKEAQQRTDAQIRALVESQQTLTERVDDVVGAVDVMRGQLRESFDNLILTNEVTRELTVQIGSLVVQTSQRLTRLEERNGNK
jgi:hypothetical protein